MCVQCSRSSGAFSDCEYPGEGPTLSQVLDGRISEVKARISELEKPGRTRHLDLHPPSSSYQSRSSSPTLSSHSSRSRSSSVASCSGEPSSYSKTSFHEPPLEARQLVFNILFVDGQRCGFFIGPECFHESFMGPFPIGHHARPTPSLLSAAYLWAVYLSPELSMTYGFDEPTLLRDARKNLSKDLAGSHPCKVVHVMQAEILLSYYFLEHGRVLQANYHANSALALSLSSKFHDMNIPWTSDISLSLDDWMPSFTSPDGHA